MTNRGPLNVVLVDPLKAALRRRSIVPWLWIVPAFFFIAVFLIYPVIDTLRLSFYNADSSGFVGLDNYIKVFTTKTLQNALLNNVLWLVLFTILGRLAA